MKTIHRFLLATGILVATTLAACSSSDDMNGTEEGAQQLGPAVKAQFTISIPTVSGGGVTRQSSAIVQQSGAVAGFRGINFIKLYPSAVLPADFSNSSVVIGNNIALSQLIIPSTSTLENLSVSNVIPNDKLYGESHTVLYGNVQLQLGARTFLFYGKAIGQNASDGTAKALNETLESYTVSDKFVNGALTTTGLTDSPSNVSGFSFALEPITTADKSNDKRAAIITYLSSIAGTEGWSTSENSGLKKLYTSFVSMRAGSSANLQEAIQDLYFALLGNGDALATAIRGNINNATYVTIDETAGTLTFNENIAGYPSTTDNLPDGAAVLQWSGATPSYATVQMSTSEMAVTSLEDYVFPACLYYWGKSGVLTSEESKLDMYKETGFDSKTWAEVANEANFANGNSISSKTRSVVLTAPIQYAVGRLDISVAASASGGVSTLPDNGTGNDAHNVNVSDIQLTGVLIGGQRAVDWKFQPVSTNPEHTIYDNITVSNGGAKALASNHDAVMNHTLVLETPGPDGDTKEKINVALEFVNNGPDFIGHDGIVAKGTKFYLVGVLDAGAATGVTGYDRTGGKVFKQDFVTRAKFTIANLKKAINTIPDLRNPAVEIGLSVDLEWQQGMEFEQTFD